MQRRMLGGVVMTTIDASGTITAIKIALQSQFPIQQKSYSVDRIDLWFK